MESITITVINTRLQNVGAFLTTFVERFVRRQFERGTVDS